MTQLYSKKLSMKRASEIREFKAQGWANKELAYLFDVSQSQVSRILRNQRLPDENYDRCKTCKWNKKKMEKTTEEWD